MLHLVVSIAGQSVTLSDFKPPFDLFDRATVAHLLWEQAARYARFFPVWVES